MSRVTIVHYAGATTRSFSVVASIAADLSKLGGTVSVLDLERTTTIRQGFPPSVLPRLFGHHVKEDAFINALRKLGANYELLEPLDTSIPLSPEHAQQMTIAVESELLTYFRLDYIPKTREARALRRTLESNAAKTYARLYDLWSGSTPDEVLIPNGRTSRQKAARLVAEALNIPVRLYENGRARRNSYYLGTTQPHDRIASQAEVKSLTSPLNEKTVQNLAKEWLESRMVGVGGTNSFSDSWKAIDDYLVGFDHETAVFFASSFDEFLAFGPMWNIDEWSSQFESFDLIMSLLEKRGVRLVLRLHPNLASKSRKYFLREVDEILHLQRRHPSLTIHWHNSSVNSYQLVMEAQYVIVERSTIGLEASLMGKPVWATQATQWDQVADIRQLLRPSDVTEEALQPWKVSIEGAERFVAYWMIQEHPLRYEATDWASWDPENAPNSMKALQLALPNSWKHKVRLLRLEWSKWRNRRFTAPVSPRQEQ